MSFTVPTATIPELTNPAPYLDQLSTDDKVPYWVAAVSKTVWMSLSSIKNLLDTGGGSTLPGVTTGTKHLYIVPANHAGNDTYVLASAAGQDFNLTLEGRPMVKDVEFEVLSAGGFKLINGDTFNEGQRYELDLFQLSGTTPGTDSGGALFTGAAQVQTNIFLDSTYFNKLLQIRGGSTRIKVTLSAIEDTPENTVVVIETAINNTKQTEIATKNGQNIYMNGSSFKPLYMGIGEDLWLFRGADGWYVIGGSTRDAYRDLCKPVDSYDASINEVPADGRTVSRLDYPRLWAKVQALGASFVSEATWQTATINGTPYPYRGCFSPGDGSTTFRVPDFTNSAVRTLKTFNLTADPERPFAGAGGFQKHAVEEHNHATGAYNKLGSIAGETSPTNTPVIDGAGGANEYRVGGMTGSDWTASEIKAYGGTETRGANIGLVKVIKA